MKKSITKARSVAMLSAAALCLLAPHEALAEISQECKDFTNDVSTMAKAIILPRRDGLWGPGPSELRERLTSDIMTSDTINSDFIYHRVFEKIISMADDIVQSGRVDDNIRHISFQFMKICINDEL